MPENTSTDAKVTLIASLLAAPPPRQLSDDIRRLALRSRATGCLVLFGLLFGAFGMVFVVLFFPWRFPQELRLKWGDADTVPGRIVSAEETSMSINKTRVMRYAFEARGAFSGEAIEGTCYTTGVRWTDGQEVTVQYLRDNPAIACPVGARLSTGTLGLGVFTLIFPTVGFGMVAGVRHQRRSILNTLRNGVIHEATVTAVESTSTRINNQTVYRIVLTRNDQPSSPPIKVRRHAPDVVARARDYLRSKQPMYILVDPRRPKRVLLPELW